METSRIRHPPTPVETVWKQNKLEQNDATNAGGRRTRRRREGDGTAAGEVRPNPGRELSTPSKSAANALFFLHTFFSCVCVCINQNRNHMRMKTVFHIGARVILSLSHRFLALVNGCSISLFFERQWWSLDVRSDWVADGVLFFVCVCVDVVARANWTAPWPTRSVCDRTAKRLNFWRRARERKCARPRWFFFLSSYLYFYVWGGRSWRMAIPVPNATAGGVAGRPRQSGTRAAATVQVQGARRAAETRAGQTVARLRVAPRSPRQGTAREEERKRFWKRKLGNQFPERVHHVRRSETTSEPSTEWARNLI